MTAFFVTATGTDVGKTHVTSRILRAVPEARAIKPVMSGYDPARPEHADAGILLKAMGQPVTEQAVAALAPWRFAAPLSPDMAAAREGRTIALGEVVAFCRSRMSAAVGPLLVEGVGGVMAPITPAETVLDWIAALRLPVILVAGSYLGTISHTLTAAAVLAGRGATIAAVVLSESETSPVPAAETAAAIGRFYTASPVHVFSRGGNGAEVRRLCVELGLISAAPF